MAESHCILGGSHCGFVAKESHLKELPPEQETERDWLELPPEMLHLIFKKLPEPDLSHVIRFRAVCNHWRSATSLSDPPPQLPWFVRKLWDYLEDSNPQKKCVRFYSMLSGPIPEIKLPESHRKELKGSAHRYLLSIDF